MTQQENTVSMDCSTCKVEMSPVRSPSERPAPFPLWIMCTGCQKVPVMGKPDKRKICTSTRGAPGSHDQNTDAPSNAADECVQQKVGEPVGRLLLTLRLLQLLP